MLCVPSRSGLLLWQYLQVINAGAIEGWGHHSLGLDAAGIRCKPETASEGGAISGSYRIKPGGKALVDVVWTTSGEMLCALKAASHCKHLLSAHQQMRQAIYDSLQFLIHTVGRHFLLIRIGGCR